MDNLRNITPAITGIKTGTRGFKDSSGNYILTGIGGDSIPAGAGSGGPFDLYKVTSTSPLTGVKATAYNTTTKEYTFASSSTSLSGYEKTPVADYVYAASGLNLIGNTVGYWTSGIPVDEHTVMLTHFSAEDGGLDVIRNITPTSASTMSFVDGKFGVGGADFSGSVANALKYTAFDSVYSNTTIDFWMCLREFKTNGVAVVFGNTLNESQTSFFNISAANISRIATQEVASCEYTLAQTYTINTWHHICLTNNSSVVKLYVDGLLMAEKTGAKGILTNRMLWIGSYYCENASHTMNGIISEFRVCDNIQTEDPNSPLYIASGETSFTPPLIPYTTA